jgi:hypothetical protein
MGAYHGWGLGTGTRGVLRRRRNARRALTIVVESTRDMGKPGTVLRPAPSVWRAKNRRS